MATEFKLAKVCSSIFEITERRYRQLAAEEIVPPVRKGLIDFPIAVRDLLRYYRKQAAGQGSITLTDERARLTKINADRKELLLKKEREEVVDTEKIFGMITEVLVKINSKISSIPMKAAPLIYGCKNVQEAQSLLEKFTDEIKNEIGNSTFYTRVAGNKPGDSSAKATTTTKHIRVGRPKQSPKS